MNKILYILLLISFSMFSQTESFDGTISEVEWTRYNGIWLTITNTDTGEILKIETPRYLRYQKKFTVQGDTLSILPPPLHVTDMWNTEQTTPDGHILFVDTSEPTTVTLFMREHRWSGTDQFWYEQSLSTVKEHHGIVIPNKFNLGINWAWDWYVIVTSESGTTFQSEIHTFKNNHVDIQILRDNEPNQGQ